MNTTQPTTTTPCCSAEKPGFFKRLFNKLDQAMKSKAEAKSGEGCCCAGSDKGKGGKCC